MGFHANATAAAMDTDGQALALQIPIQFLFKTKKIPMQQWRKLRPVSIDGFMALNIINFADMILLI